MNAGLVRSPQHRDEFGVLNGVKEGQCFLGKREEIVNEIEEKSGTNSRRVRM